MDNIQLFDKLLLVCDVNDLTLCGWIPSFSHVPIAVVDSGLAVIYSNPPLT